MNGKVYGKIAQMDNNKMGEYPAGEGKAVF